MKRPCLKNYLLIGLLLLTYSVYSATEFAHIEQRVIASLKIVKKSDMLFPDAISGDGPYSIPASSSDTPENASFIVSGEPGKVFRVILPQDGQVKLRRRGHFGKRSTVKINRFKSNLNNNFGKISKRGTQELFVGATRESLLPNQKSGRYRGHFHVTVIY